jgi:hypothetical protein
MGKIKEGLGALIGNAGEHYVMAELLKRGIIAALAPRNAPGFDILATKPEKPDEMVRIRIKTKSEKYDIWQYSVKKDESIFRFLQHGGDFTVLVHLADDVKDVRYFIVPTKLIQDWLIKDFKEWLRTPGRGGRPRSKESKKRILQYSKHEEDLMPFENNWDSFWG